MDVTGEERIAAPRDKVWAGLNDADILKRCIPHCQSLEWQSDSELAAVIRIKLGPFSSNFSGTITLSNVNAPASYRLSAAGKGGILGFAQGAADVELVEDGGQTILRYRAAAELGGRLAQMGTKLIGAATQRLAARFFSDFNDAVSEERTEA
ncbi:carbon monoxide dehydrogenase subunit G [Neorhizobium sp. JUb45]|uniref:CoxG family protein n=1 Tax=unclassified Neorhizobium TaxID=2629175 RepID=UPI00105273FB|nr:carbon monoxide dehydrogenase subunit G [Neorhizobium sp. JUb45]TCR02024.1 hypothetical protein EDF70_104301 [Neorhizobium sp. JUb45]